MTNNIEEIEELLSNYRQYVKLEEYEGLYEYKSLMKNRDKTKQKILNEFKSMQLQIDTLKSEADEDESRESESL